MPEDRRSQAVAAARVLLEREGEAALSMRRVADVLGIRAPSLYKHVADKAELEVELIAQGLAEIGAAMADAPPRLAGVAAAYRSWALEHPALYLLMTQRPLPRDRLPAGLEASSSSPLLRVLPDEHAARAAWSAAHGLVSLELAGRYPAGADLDAAWAAMVDAFTPRR